MGTACSTPKVPTTATPTRTSVPKLGKRTSQPTDRRVSVPATIQTACPSGNDPISFDESSTEWVPIKTNLTTGDKSPPQQRPQQVRLAQSSKAIPRTVARTPTPKIFDPLSYPPEFGPVIDDVDDEPYDDLERFYRQYYMQNGGMVSTAARFRSRSFSAPSNDSAANLIALLGAAAAGRLPATALIPKEVRKEDEDTKEDGDPVEPGKYVQAQHVYTMRMDNGHSSHAVIGDDGGFYRFHYTRNWHRLTPYGGWIRIPAIPRTKSQSSIKKAMKSASAAYMQDDRAGRKSVGEQDRSRSSGERQHLGSHRRHSPGATSRGSPTSMKPRKDGADFFSQTFGEAPKPHSPILMSSSAFTKNNVSPTIQNELVGDRGTPLIRPRVSFSKDTITYEITTVHSESDEDEEIIMTDDKRKAAVALKTVLEMRRRSGEPKRSQLERKPKFVKESNIPLEMSPPSQMLHVSASSVAVKESGENDARGRRTASPRSSSVSSF